MGLFDLKDLSRRIRALLYGSDDFTLHLKRAGLDPATDLCYGDYSGIDLGDADVAGWNFTGVILTDSNLSRVRNITQAIFDADTDLEGAKLPKGITVEQLLQSRPN